MAAKNDKLPGHKWKILDQSYGSFFYKCTACGHTTPNGVPLKPPYDKECKK